MGQGSLIFAGEMAAAYGAVTKVKLSPSSER